MRVNVPIATPIVSNAAPVFAMVFTTSGFSLTNVRTSSRKGFISFMPSLSEGRKVSPSVEEIALIWFCSSNNWFSVVAARAAYSFCIEPPYCCASATRLKLVRNKSRFVSSGAMDPEDSLPNSSLSAATCFSFGNFARESSTCSMAPRASFCISAASFFGLMRNERSTFFCDLVAESPAVSDSIKFFIPVAAISDSTPIPAMVAPIAAISPEATPATLPKGPIRVTTSEIFFALAGPVLPR